MAVGDKKYKNSQKRKDAFISTFIGFFAFVWIFPILWTVWTSLRPYQDIIENGVFSWPDTLNLFNYFEAFRLMNIMRYLANSFIVAIPGVILTLFFGSLLAFVVIHLNLIYICCCYLPQATCYRCNWFMHRYLRFTSGLVI
ncbi:MAG: hypothetical protein RLZ15_962 [Actinomycetota bacterium]